MSNPLPVKTLPAAMAILRKDLLLELRSRESLLPMSLFAVVTVVAFHFALDRSTVSGQLAAGVIWITVILAALLGVNRLFVAEHEEGGFTALRLSGVDPTAMATAKALALFIYLTVLEVVAFLAAFILLLTPFSVEQLPLLVVVALFVNGITASLGALVSALATQSRTRELLVPILLLPLSIPTVIAASQASGPLLELNPSTPAGRWLLLLGLYNIVSGLLCWALFDFLIED